MINPRTMITDVDIKSVTYFLTLGNPLSGYLAGNPYGGAAVQRLEDVWSGLFKRRHAICCNSATSGLLAACVALQVDRQTTVAVPALSMSATAAIPHWLGAKLQWADCDAFGGANHESIFGSPDVIIATTLFGHPVDRTLREIDSHMILDNAQGILSRYADGTWSENIASICVTSFNVHKQINAGEMGIITTDDSDLAATMRGFINHGENAWGEIEGRHDVGLNLRPTEISAILALSQVRRIEETIGNLESLARRLTDNMPSTFTPILPREGTQSAWYCYAFRVPEDRRDDIVVKLNRDGVPCSPMYNPLYHLPAFYNDSQRCDNAEKLSRDTIILELCAWRYEDDITAVAQALQKAAKL